MELNKIDLFSIIKDKNFEESLNELYLLEKKEGN